MPLAKTDHKQYVKQMEQMLRDRAYDWAWEKIDRLKDWVEHNEEITPEIINCLQNMRRKAGDL
jgi:hypothetical protein